MKKQNSRTYLYIALGGLVLIIALVIFYMLTPVSRAEQTQYLYVDDDDTQECCQGSHDDHVLFIEVLLFVGCKSV